MATHINGSRNSEGLFSGTDPILTFSDEENQWASNFRSIRIENQNEYVCLLVRDSIILKLYYLKLTCQNMTIETLK